MFRVPAIAASACASASSSSSPPPEVREEAGRRELVRVTGDDRPAGAHQRSHRVGGGDLGGLVEDRRRRSTAPLAAAATTTKGDMAQHGLSAPSTCGAAWNSCRTGRWPRLRRA